MKQQLQQKIRGEPPAKKVLSEGTVPLPAMLRVQGLAQTACNSDAHVKTSQQVLCGPKLMNM
jgi:hypothetical protein